ncbi:MAG: PD40 domain-containing protein [Planctomycetales bacterium]|nr:PD40 domain-containing protein [Planctomycetales bacterium]MBN8625666.1 PD40 domain-containing protein [Planctomycetota bacterium]
MSRSIRCFAGVALLVCGNFSTALRADEDPVAPWRANVTIRQVSTTSGRHTLHAYYVCNPESPDGSHVVYFASTAANAHVGEVCIIERATGKETVLASGVHTEDAHRGACQQWISGGKKVAFHEAVGRRWQVVTVDIATGERKVVAENRQLGFGNPAGDVLPLYGCHWNPGDMRDLELLNIATGDRRITAKADEVVAKYGDWVQQEFQGKPISIFFPVISPDQKRAFLKIAAGNGGDNFMSKGASQRQGLLVYDFDKAAFTYHRTKWGHPAWLSDSQRIIEMGNIIIDARDGKTFRMPNLPQLRGMHPSTNPAATLMATDGELGTDIRSEEGEWGVMVADLRGDKHVLLDRFRNSAGARSWRKNHPHPTFSADGQRIYYNVNEGEWTTLMVAEIGAAPAAKASAAISPPSASP